MCIRDRACVAPRGREVRVLVGFWLDLVRAVWVADRVGFGGGQVAEGWLGGSGDDDSDADGLLAADVYEIVPVRGSPPSTSLRASLDGRRRPSLHEPCSIWA